MSKEILYIDMDGVLCNYSKAYNEHLERNPEIKHPQSQYGFFTNLEPMEYCEHVVPDLMGEYDVYILTAPSTKNPLSYTEKRVWIEEHFGMELVRKLIMSPNKGLLKGDYLIDDNWTGNGQENFEGELIRFGSDLFPDWYAINNRFLNPFKL